MKKFYELNFITVYLCIAVAMILLTIFVLTAIGGEVDLTKAVIHHTASRDVSAKIIDKWHKKRGWDGIGYHFVIRKNGDIEKGRSLNKRGAHALGRNNWVGIALTGNDTYTVEQVYGLKKLLKRLGVTYIEPHHSRGPGPGLDLVKFWEEYDSLASTNRGMSWIDNRWDEFKVVVWGWVIKYKVWMLATGVVVFIILSPMTLKWLRGWVLG